MDAQLQARIRDGMRFFIGKGWLAHQAAGVVGNLQAESNVLPTQAQYGGGPGYGLGQWEKPRQADFRAWSGHDIHQSTFTEQLEFVQHELLTTQRAAGDALRHATTAREAGAIVCRLYERPADIAGQSIHRGELAEKIMAAWIDFGNVAAGSETTAPAVAP